jgi:hypothetical protein
VHPKEPERIFELLPRAKAHVPSREHASKSPEHHRHIDKLGTGAYHGCDILDRKQLPFLALNSPSLA